MKLRFLLIFLPAVVQFFSARAQQGFGTATPDANAVIELASANKGLLLPRVALTGMTSPAPLQNHVAGMLVYNTADAGLVPNVVSPGYYFNNGTKWIRLQYTAQKAWNNSANGQPANANNQDIYQLGKVGIGTATPQNALDILGDGTHSPLVVQSLQPKDNSVGYKMVMINNTTGIVSYTDVPPPASFVAQNITGTQNFSKPSFTSSSNEASASVLTFSNTLISNTFGSLSASGDVFTVLEVGDYDIMGSCNLLMPVGSANYAAGAADNTFMNVTVAIQLKKSGGSWASIAAVTNTLNYASFGLTSTLKPVSTLYKLGVNDQIRLIIYRGAGISLLTTGTAPRTDASQNGIVQDKLLKITKYN